MSKIGKLWDEGIASGPARERPIDDIIAEAKARLGTARDESIASGPPADGPPIMKRLRSKYQAISGKQRKSKR